MTPAQQQALSLLDEYGGEGVINKFGKMIASGKSLAFLADTWLRLITTGHVEPRGAMRLGLTDAGRSEAAQYRSNQVRKPRPETIHPPDGRIYKHEGAE